MRDDELRPGDWVLQVKDAAMSWQDRELASYANAPALVSPYFSRAVRLIELTTDYAVVFDPWDLTPKVLALADYSGWRLASSAVVSASVTTWLRRLYNGFVSHERVRVNLLKLDEIVRRLVAGRADWDEVNRWPEAEAARSIELGNLSAGFDVMASPDEPEPRQ